MASQSAFQFGVQHAIQNRCDIMFNKLANSNFCSILNDNLEKVLSTIQNDKGIQTDDVCDVLEVCTSS
ncbi:unnamed protein product [Bursaphelenchus okinawaensis]|uniref:Uncharacterized protein n=1 Tax=Bursaphelenchus okinawaensis TaxID=465554 RepID=A0A811KLU1_9BILA|nr:unnamed protein product [Bursaphelenchus okinawaensis]CAG9107253.1 unnamed protein product [Bursaphelenchus okinawaensis]